MHTIAFVGPSGTGKSHRAIAVARENRVDAFIDDGLLISGTKVLAGISAKREATRIASVKRALFMSKSHADTVKTAIRKNNIQKIMLLGTSDGMVNKIAAALDLPPIERIIRIEDVSTPEEMQLAHDIRTNQGKHVIPVPAFEIKKDFSGYFLHPARLFQKNMDKEMDKYDDDKSIVRPTFSYMGDYEISDRVVVQASIHEAMKNPFVYKVSNINVRKTNHGVHLDMAVILRYGCNINSVCRAVQYRIEKNVESYTSINVRRVHIYVKGIKVGA